MNWTIRQTITVVLALLAWRTIGHSADTDWATLTTRPLDSAEAKNCRIWYQVKHSQPCRVTLDILDSGGQRRRRMFTKLLTEGYYNFYWDKRDDSGQFVEAGSYGYQISDCGQIDSGKVMASFKRWELLSKMLPDAIDSSFVSLELLADSARVSVLVLTKRGDTLALPIMDTLLSSGRHELAWNSRSKLRRGFYQLIIKVGDFIYRRKGRVR